MNANPDPYVVDMKGQRLFVKDWVLTLGHSLTQQIVEVSGRMVRVMPCNVWVDPAAKCVKSEEPAWVKMK